MGSDIIEERTFEYCGYTVTMTVGWGHEMFDGRYRYVRCIARKGDFDDRIRVKSRYYVEMNMVKHFFCHIFGDQASKDLEKQIDSAAREIRDEIESTVDERTNVKATAQTKLDSVVEEMKDA